MQQRKFVLTALTMAALITLSGCGGGGAGDQTLKVKFSSQVTFGDSLSDVGTYAVGTVAQKGGGKFTINGDNTAINPALTGKNWTELMATQFGLPAPCAAETGLNGSAAAGYMEAIKTYPGCFGYAQGGARVTELIGPGNAATGNPLGALTVPVAGQIAMHLAAVSTHKFKGDEMVFVMAGGNDVLYQLGVLTAEVTAGKDPATLGPVLVASMATAGSELVALVKTQILANGANYVTVNNLPDVASTPFALAQSASTRALIAAMVSAFNTQLSNGFAGEGRVLLVDVYGVSHDQAINPAPYGLTNVTDTACDLSPAKNSLASALVCNAGNLNPGDVSHYAYADMVHPTPFNNLLLARYVSEKLVLRGWL